MNIFKTMCQDIKLLARVKSGALSKCFKCNTYYLQFNNLYFTFSQHEFNAFKEYLLNIEFENQSQLNCSTNHIRKIAIQSRYQNLLLIFSQQELKELLLLFCEDAYFLNDYLSLEEIDSPFILN